MPPAVWEGAWDGERPRRSRRDGLIPPAQAEPSARSLNNRGAATGGRPEASGSSPRARWWPGSAALGWAGPARRGRGLDSAIPPSRELSRGGGRWNGAWNPTARLDAKQRACARARAGSFWSGAATCWVTSARLMLLSVKWEREHPSPLGGSKLWHAELSRVASLEGRFGFS